MTPKFGAPMFVLTSFGSKCTVFKKVLVTLLGLLGATHSDSAQWQVCPLVTPFVVAVGVLVEFF